MKSSEDEDDEATNFEIGCDKAGRMKKLKISATVNDELKVSNFMKFKYVLCKHPQSCFWYQVKSVPQNFLKGAAMGGYASFLILILKSKRERGIPKSVFEILIEIYRTQKKLMCRMGCLAASFSFLYKFFLCLLRAYFQSSFHRSFPFFSGCNHPTYLGLTSMCSFRLDHDPPSLLPA